MNKEVIVFTSGSWDLFHMGHLNMLKRSKELGTKLVVGVSTDELIEEYKGLPPVIPFEQRMEIVRANKYVDVVVRQTILTEIRQLKEFKVDIVTIGDDWKNRFLEGLEWMKEHGKEVFYLLLGLFFNLRDMYKSFHPIFNFHKTTIIGNIRHAPGESRIFRVTTCNIGPWIITKLFQS